MRILIIGLPRSGTSALYFKLKQALPATTWCLYEPKRFKPSASVNDVLAKILIGAFGDFDYDSFENFEKRILIVRDPRDHLVSRLLYRACADPEFRQDDAKVAGFIQALRQKEAAPQSISFLGLLDRYNNLRAGDQPQRMTAPTGPPRSWAVSSHPMALEFHQGHGGLHTYKYEDFVAGHYKSIEDYLEISVPAGEATVSHNYEHVARSKASGDWRHWLAQSDIDFFRPYLLPYMRAYGYADDWTLAERPYIESQHASEFVRRSVAQRRHESTVATP